MKILIVDDCGIKTAKIESVIKDYCDSEEITFDRTTNSADTISLLKNNEYFDFLILDLNLPVRDGEKPKKETGERLLKEIIRQKSITKPVEIIGLTAYPEIKLETQQKFTNRGWLLVCFNLKKSDWVDTIVNRINYTMEENNQKSNGGKVDVLLFSALSKEFSALKNKLTNVKEESHDTGAIYEVGSFNGLKIGLVETGVGNVISGVEAERALSHFKPKISMFVGIGGGIKDVAIGDVVAGSKVYWMESGKDGKEYKSRANYGESSYKMQQKAKAMKRDSTWNSKHSQRSVEKFNVPSVLYIAPIASGEKVVVSKESESFKKIEGIAGDALAVAMEEFGFLEASKAYPQIQKLIVRGISDLIDKKSETDLLDSQELAAFNASEMAFDLIEKYHE